MNFFRKSSGEKLRERCIKYVISFEGVQCASHAIREAEKLIAYIKGRQNHQISSGDIQRGC